MPLGAARITLLARSSVTAEVIRRKVGVSAVGNAQVDTAQSKFGRASALFDGTGDRLDLYPNGKLAFGTTNFTIEYWFRYSGSLPNQNRMTWEQRPGSNGVYPLVYHTTSGQVVYFVNSSARITSSSLSADTWYHLAIVRNGSTTTMYINGSSEGSFSDSFNYLEGTPRIGDNMLANSSHSGHIDEIRASNTARYTTGFTPPTAPFQNDESTLLLLHMDGTDASTLFEDDNGVRAKISSSAENGASIKSTGAKFGPTSFQSGYTGDRQNGRRLKVNHSDIWSLDQNELTIECWVWVDEDFGSTSTLIWSTRPSTGSDGLGLVCNSSPNYFSITDAPNGLFISTSNWSIDTWHHLAFTRNKSTGTIELFMDGVSQGTNTYSRNWIEKLTIANIEYASILSFPGLIDEFRVSDTIRYTNNFTAPTEPFQNDDNTLLLLHMDGTDASTDFVDDNGGGRSAVGVTAEGNAQVDTAQSKFGGGSYLSTATDGLRLSPVDSFGVGTGDITIEMWYRTTSTATNQCLYDQRDTANGYYPALFNNGSNIKMWWNSAYRLTNNTTISNNTWYHVALVRNSGDWKIYVNGSGSSSYTAGDSIAPNDDAVIGYNFNDVSGTIGNIDEFRISNTARYTANFTAPTEPFQNDDNTLLLLHMDGTDGSTTFMDDNGVPPNYDYGA